MAELPLPRNAVEHKQQNGNITFIHFTYNQPDDASEFDSKYTGNGHGGNPVNNSYPKNGPSIDNKTIDLKKGENKISLLHINSIADIKNIAIEFIDRKEYEVSLTKKSFSGTNEHKVTVKSNDLYSIRTMFVAYLDTYTQLYIKSPDDAILRINY